MRVLLHTVIRRSMVHKLLVNYNCRNTFNLQEECFVQLKADVAKRIRTHFWFL